MTGWRYSLCLITERLLLPTIVSFFFLAHIIINNNKSIHDNYKLCASFQIHRWIQTGDTVQKRSPGWKVPIFLSPWSWKLMDDLEKQEDNPSTLHQALCIISNPSVKSNLSYSPESLNSGQNWRFFLSCVTLKIDGWPWKTIYGLSYAASSFVHHFMAIGEFKLELQSGNAQFGSTSKKKIAVWSWNLTDDLEQQKGTFSKHHQALCIISSPYVI